MECCSLQNICTLCTGLCLHTRMYTKWRRMSYCRLKNFHLALTAQITAICAETSLSWGLFYEPVGVSDNSVVHHKSADEWSILNDLKGSDLELIDLLFVIFLEAALDILLFNFSGRNQENHLLSKARQRMNLLNSQERLPDTGTELYPCSNQFGSDCFKWKSNM
jgi:hypothetical protein